MSQNEEFSYSLTRNKGVVLIQFTGRIKAENLEKLNECQNQILADRGIKIAVFDFASVVDIPLTHFPDFAKFQKIMRAELAEIRLCGLAEDLKTKLVRSGIVRNAELSNNLPEALRRIGRAAVPEGKKAA